MTYSDVEYEKQGRIAVIRFNRPEKLNAIRTETILELMAIMRELDADDDVHCALLTGNGRAFCVGADMDELRNLSSEVWLGRNPPPRQYTNLVQAVRNLGKAVVVAIGGWCVGGGCSLALSCDIGIASDDAMFYYPETAYGFPSPSLTSLMMWHTTPFWVKEILFCGRKIDAETALRIGLVNRVVPRAELVETALGIAEEIASRPPRAIRMQKEMINQLWMHGWDSIAFTGIQTSVAAHADFSWQARVRDSM